MGFHWNKHCIAILLIISAAAVCGTPVSILQSPPLLSVHNGQTAALNCSISNHRQLNLQLVLFYWYLFPGHPEKKANATKELAIENSTHTSIFEVDIFMSSLTLRNLTPYDEGVYRCCVYVVVPSAKEYRGNGTVLSIKAAPVVSLTAGTVDERRGLVNLTCSVMGFYPQDVTVSWENTPIGIPPSIQQHPLTLNQDGTYSTSSSLLASPETDMTCAVNHPSLAEPIRKTSGKGGVPQHYYYFLIVGLIVFVPVLIWILKKTTRYSDSRNFTDRHNPEVEQQADIMYTSIQHRQPTTMSTLHPHTFSSEPNHPILEELTLYSTVMSSSTDSVRE
ncbi:natural cytotoxicity triggering receptor 3 ligand 1-like isoform X2 [Polyodon spathula]|uniref:natural cytotoxicity triggering receptor 3 ligand 1-like isoform X2 n=1 Tax=Polyodon spathula TaxID=7913 RepID=UPI001B7E5C53|nr:natural cytotoxicity triggering receptor 3 ligand 1-like isoform X2 [Polyodon spathula]